MTWTGKVTRSLRGMTGPLACAAVLIAQPQRAATQTPRDVVFQHGLRSDSTTWFDEALALQSNLEIAGYARSTTWTASFATQAAQLAARVPDADADAILIGHSNGGLVGRTANMPAPYPARPWGGLITVATPHGGAQLATYVANGVVGSWISGILSDISNACDAYGYGILDNVTGDWSWVANTILAAVGWKLHALAQQAQIANAAAAEFWTSNPVSGEMEPGSSFLTGVLNTSGNLSREAAAIPGRIGITSAVSTNTGLPFHALFADWQDKHNTKVIIAAAFNAAEWAAQLYDDESDPNRSAINNSAYLWGVAAYDLYGVDDVWCSLIGAWDGQCGPSDAVMPVTAQTYPGATRIDIAGPSHIEETHASEVDGQLYFVLRSVFGVPQRPGPPSFWANMSGTSTMRPGDSCHWFGQTNIENAQYLWTVNGVDVGTDSDFYWSASSDFTLSFQAWNDNGQAGGETREISVSEEYDQCYDQTAAAYGGR